jgi:Zn-dependent peptidase ImmA (M78 family)
MKPLRPRYNRIRRCAADLLFKSAIEQPAVPVERLAKAAGAAIEYRDFNNEISGLLIRKQKMVVIAVADEQPKQRQRFTIAHELGHLLLHDGIEVRVDKHFRINLRSSASSKAEDVEEIEANAFAAELLMPRDFLLRDARKLMFDMEDEEQVSSLARRYDVSRQAMTFRLMNLFGESN